MIDYQKLKTEIVQARENNFIESEIRTISCVIEHPLNFFDNVGFVFEKNIFTNDSLKKLLVLKFFL